jgi:hypothetical protein
MDELIIQQPNYNLCSSGAVTACIIRSSLSLSPYIASVEDERCELCMEASKENATGEKSEPGESWLWKRGD